MGTDGAALPPLEVACLGPPLEVGPCNGEAADQRAILQVTFLELVLVLARGGEFVLFVVALIAGYMLPSESWRLV